MEVGGSEEGVVSVGVTQYHVHRVGLDRRRVPSVCVPVLKKPLGLTRLSKR